MMRRALFSLVRACVLLLPPLSLFHVSGQVVLLAELVVAAREAEAEEAEQKAIPSSPSRKRKREEGEGGAAANRFTHRDAFLAQHHRKRGEWKVICDKLRIHPIPDPVLVRRPLPLPKLASSLGPGLCATEGYDPLHVPKLLEACNLPSPTAEQVSAWQHACVWLGSVLVGYLSFSRYQTAPASFVVHVELIVTRESHRHLHVGTPLAQSLLASCTRSGSSYIVISQAVNGDAASWWSGRLAQCGVAKAALAVVHTAYPSICKMYSDVTVLGLVLDGR